jgi:hypothetical protein
MSFPAEGSLILQPGTLSGNGIAPDVSDRTRATLDFVADLRSQFETRDKIYRDIDEVIFLEQAVNIPENYKASAIEVRSPYPRHIANQITASLSINNPRVHFDPVKFGDTGENEAAHRSRFFEASWLRQQREKRRRIFRLFMDSVVTKGDGILKTIERKHRAWAKYTPYSQDLLKRLDEQVRSGQLDEDSRTRIWDASTEEMKRKLPYPIETTEIPPESFYYQKGEDGFVRVAEIAAVPYYQTLLQYGATLNGRGQVVSYDDIASYPLPADRWGEIYGSASSLGNLQTIERIEVWDLTHCRIILRGPGDFAPKGFKGAGSGLMVREWEHGYGDLDLGVLRGPYFHAPGILTSSREPHKAHLSVLFAYRHLFPLLNSLLTMQSQAAFAFSYPAYRRTTPPAYNIPESPFGVDASEIAGARERIVPGAIFPHDIAPMDQPKTSVDLDKAIQFVKAMIDLALPDTIQGAVTGEMAGYTLNQAAHLATLTWGPIVENVQDCLSDRVGWESRLIDEHIGETVYVWGRAASVRKSGGSQQAKTGWIGLGPKDIDGVHNYEVTLEPATINTDQLELRVLRDELDMRLIDPAEAVRSRGRNPVEVERAWLLYELKQDPEIRNNLKQRIFQDLGTIEQQTMEALGPDGQPAPVSGQPTGATPGVSQGLPTTGFVPQQGAVPGAPPPPAAPPGGPGGPGGPPPPMSLPRPPGPTPGSPAGLRPPPANHEPVPGGG